MNPSTPNVILNSLTPLAAEAMTEAPFTTATQAWQWATEVLRRRRLPPTSPAWRDDTSITPHQRQVMQAELPCINLAAEATQVAAVWGKRFNPSLPQGAAERYALAQRIQAAVLALPPAEATLLQLWAWGDWENETRLRQAQLQQEIARRHGMRVRLCYRYSATQLAHIMGCSKAQAWRRVRAALAALSKNLQSQRIVGVVAVPSMPKAHTPTPVTKRPVRVAQFKQG
jgi:DNA-directed RNA polymerase specialized sigma24 family protein